MRVYACLIFKAGGKEHALICAQTSRPGTARFKFLRNVETCKCLQLRPAREDPRTEPLTCRTPLGELLSILHPSPKSRRAVTPGAALTRTRRLQSGRGRGGRVRKDGTEGWQAGAWGDLRTSWP